MWLSHDLDGLHEVLQDQPYIRWVQLPFAGIEKAVAAGLIGGDRAWTSAKGSYAQPVAEHALLLALAGLRLLPERIRAHSWGPPAGTSLHGAGVTVVGGGGITTELLGLLAPFGVSATVVRRQAEAGARRGPDRDHGPSRRRLAGRPGGVPGPVPHPRDGGDHRPAPAGLMDGEAWLVNVARGGHVRPTPWSRSCGPGPSPAPPWTSPNRSRYPTATPFGAAELHNHPHTADTWEMMCRCWPTDPGQRRPFRRRRAVRGCRRRAGRLLPAAPWPPLGRLDRALRQVRPGLGPG